MYIKNIHLLNFKNYSDLSLSFTSDINCIVGPNGIGKTNLLDAIYYLCMTKSAFTNSELLNITHENSFFLNEGFFINDSEIGSINETIKCAYKKGEKKSVWHNKKEYEKMSEHIGKFPCVLITPYDTDLVREGSETRRKFFDNTLSQTDSNYLASLIRYNHYLKQRNFLLKQFAERKTTDFSLLETYNAQMLPLARKIFDARNSFMATFTPHFLGYYQKLCNAREAISITYTSKLKENSFEVLLKQSLQKDLALQRTTEGIHKDDFSFDIDGFPLKKLGSQGQQKSYIIALKLAQYAWIKQQKQTRPIMLLDDIFDKLDEGRINQLLSMIANDEFGQIFITDARPERSEKLLEKLNKEVKFFYIDQLLPE